MAHFDLIVRNGQVIDGSGGESQQCDIGVKDGVITQMEKNLTATATREIDAQGKMVTPGFVDVHTHYDGQVTWDSHLNPSSNLGTTTVVMGNCGVGFAPCRPDDHDVMIELMEGVEEIPGTALAEGLPWTWESFPEYLDTVDSIDHDIDVAALVPHGPLRVYVMGERALNREPANENDIAEMKKLLSESISAGGVGFSTSRTLVHKSSKGNPVPTYQAATDELVQLGEVLSGDDGSVFQLISDWEDVDNEFSILRRTSERTGAKGTFTLLQLDHQPDLWKQQLGLIESAQSDGLDIRGQVLSRPVGILMGHPASMSPFSPRPTYRKLEGLPWDEMITELKKPEVKQQILSEALEDQAHMFVQIFCERFDKMYPLQEPIEYLPQAGTSIADEAEKAGVEPASWLYDYFLTNNGHSLIYIAAANFSDHIPELLQHPLTVSALGDGGAHVGSICDTSANLYVLTKWVKERKAFNIETAINMLTRQPAELYSLNDRGLLEVGMKADINIIDFDALALKTPHIVHDLPAGGKRFLQNADGITATIVSGQVIYEDGKATGALPGKLIRGQQKDPRAA